MTETFSQALGKLARNRQFLVVGDDHSDSAIETSFFNPAVYRELKAAGVKHFFLEVPVEEQGTYDRLYKGKITRDEFVDELMSLQSTTMDEDTKRKLLENQAGLVEWARDNGVKVHCASDRRTPLRELANDPDVIKDYKANAPADMVTGDRISLDAYLLTHPDIPMPDGSKVSVLNDDRPLAELVQSRVGKDKAVIHYGADHQASSYGIDELLGEDKTGRVVIYNGIMDRPSRKFNEILDGNIYKTYTPDPDPHDLEYYCHSGEIVWPKGEPAGEQKPAAVIQSPKNSSRPVGP